MCAKERGTLMKCIYVFFCGGGGIPGHSNFTNKHY